MTEGTPPETPEERARHAMSMIQSFGWEVRHQGPIPDDGWPIDIITGAIRDAIRAEQERCCQVAETPEAWNNLPIADDGQAIAAAIRRGGVV